MLNFLKSREAPKTPAKPQAPAKAQPRKKAPQTREAKPFLLTPFGFFLSACSVAWTTFSVVDLMGIGPIGLTVAVSLDIIWVAIMYATHMEIPFYGSLRATQIIGWVFLLAVVGILAWHGASLEGKEFLGYAVDSNMARGMAIAGPILPVGAKVFWVLVSSAYKKAEQEAQNPEGYTEEQLAALADMERTSKFEAAESEKDLDAMRREHQVELEKIRMDAEKARTRDDVDFEIRIQRIEQQRKIQNNTPLPLPRVIQGEIERVEDPAPRRQLSNVGPVKPRSIPATAAARSEVTVSITDLSETQRENMLMAAEFHLLREKDATYTQSRFASEKGISAGYLSKILLAYKKAKENDTLDLGDEAVNG
jgi:hypothetical protein